MRSHLCAALLAASVCAGLPATAGDVTAGALRIEHPWSRPTIPNRPAAAYAVIRNEGETADALIGASSPAFERAELHAASQENGVMKMAPVEALPIEPGGEAALAPGALHLMLFGASQPLREGDSFPLTLEFRNAGPVEVSVTVESRTYGIGGMEHGAMPGMGGDGAMSGMSGEGAGSGSGN